MAVKAATSGGMSSRPSRTDLSVSVTKVWGEVLLKPCRASSYKRGVGGPGQAQQQRCASLRGGRSGSAGAGRLATRCMLHQPAHPASHACAPAAAPTSRSARPRPDSAPPAGACRASRLPASAQVKGSHPQSRKAVLSAKSQVLCTTE